MWFRNLQIYRLSENWEMDAETLERQLEKRPFQRCGSQEEQTRGWISPTSDDFLLHRVGKQWLISLGVEQRILPAAVVKQEAEERAEEMAAEQGFKPGRKQMKELREQITQEFLPRAFTRRNKVFAWIDPVGGWLGVDAPSQLRAEDVLEHLRQTLDVLPLRLIRSEQSPANAMADWLAAGEGPPGFTIDQDCELRSVTEEKAAVRYVRHNLDADEVRSHLEAGKLPTRLAMTFDDRLSFVLTDKLEIKRLEFLDVVKEQLEDANDEDARALFDAGFALMTAELTRMLPSLIEVLGGECQADGEQRKAA